MQSNMATTPTSFMHNLFLALVVVALFFWQGEALLIQPKTSSGRHAVTTRLTATTSDSNSWRKINQFAKVTLLSVATFAQIAGARPAGVDRPDLLPKEQNVPLIDVANFLSKGQEKKMIADINELQKLTGYKLRVLCQSYPNTPGLAIKDYWGVDDNTVVLVADKGEGFNKQGIPSNIMNLNIGKVIVHMAQPLTTINTLIFSTSSSRTRLPHLPTISSSTLTYTLSPHSPTPLAYQRTSMMLFQDSFGNEW